MRLNISSKLMLLGLGCIFMTALGLVVAGVWQGKVFSERAQAETVKLVNADLEHITQNAYSLIRAQDESIQQKVNHDLNVARYILNSNGPITLSEETVGWHAVNQFTQKQVEIDLPKMMVGPQWLGQNDQMWLDSPVVDKVKRLVGGTVTIFQRMNRQGDILRVTTNVEKNDGTRAIGTYIPAVNPDGTPNPVVSKVMRGETYRGVAYVVNAWYVTAYEPLYDQWGEMIGVLYVGVKQENIQSLRQAIIQVRIGRTGYVFVLGGKGDHQGHYIISHNGLRDGENIWNSMDSQGHAFIQEGIKRVMALPPGETTTSRYLWRNPGEPAPRWKMVRLVYYEPWDWVIGSSVYEDELKGSAIAITKGYQGMIRMFGVLAAVIALIGGTITWFLARKMSHTLLVVTRAATTLTEQDLPRLVRAMDAVNSGDLTVRFHFDPTAVRVNSKDELGTMADAFTSMNLALVSVGTAFTAMVANLHELTGQLEQRVADRTHELRESERRLADIINFLPDATMVIDRNGHVIAWNHAMEKLTGVSRKKMIGKGGYEYAMPLYGHRRPMLIDLVLHPDAAFEKNYKFFKREENILTGEVSTTHLNRQRVTLSCTASALWNDSGEKVGAIETLRDTTQWVEIEEELIDSRLKAEAATQAKSEFLANMSHEIRTPLNGVIVMAGLLLETDLTSRQRRYAEIVSTSAESLLDLINDILDFSKIEAKKLALDAADFNLRDLLDDVTEMLAVKAHEKELELTCLLAPGVPALISGDPGRLRQVLTNLAGNAVKFTQSGEVIIWCDLETEDLHSVTVNCSVVDTGIGIPADKQNDLFTPFTQVDGSNTRKYGGTGLGLAISKQLVELMGGRIGLESEPGQGSMFWFTATLKKQKRWASPEPAVPVADIRGTNVLVVDDNDANRLLLRILLESWGCACTVSATADSALAHLRKAAAAGNPFQVTLLDFQMPGMDGLTLGRQIKADAQLQETMLIMLTSLGDHRDLVQLRQAGFVAYQTKPIRQHQLRESIAAALGLKKHDSAQGSRSPIANPKPDPSITPGIRILVVDDAPTNREVALAILKKLGCRSDAVVGGREALASLSAAPYDLVLMDCQMPEMDGYKTTRQIRRGTVGICPSSIPIVAMTANAMQGDREKCLEAGMNDYMTKPISPAVLARVLARWVPRPILPCSGQSAQDGACHDPGNTPAGRPDQQPTNPEEGAVDIAVVFDAASLNARLMGDTAMAKTVINGFLTDIPKQIEILRSAVRQGHSAEAEQLAHRIKGAAGNIGGLALERVARDMETAGKAGAVSRLDALLPVLDDQFASLKSALEQV